MSELENVSKKILDDADKERQEILGEAEKKAQAILDEARKKKEEILSEAKREASEKYDQVYGREISKGKALMDQKILLLKLELLEKVMEKAKESLAGLGTKEYISYIKNVLEDIDISEGQYVVGSKEKKLKQEELKPLMDKIGVKNSKEGPDFEEGLKILSGNAEYSISPLKAIEAIEDEIKIDIASFIFGEEN
jgi:V/A-type H+/Na+-transporting ATPase subunit E